MGNNDDEDLLSLRLAIVTDSSREKKTKRKRTEVFSNWELNEACDQGQVCSLLQLREQMLRLDHKRSSMVEDGKGVHLIHLLLISAKSVYNNNINSAVQTLSELYQNVSLRGDSIQRVSAYFADALVAKLVMRKSPFYDMIMKAPTPKEEFLAFTELYKVSPFYQFAHFTANQAIIEAFEEEQIRNNGALHVIDFDILYGFQWPSLIQSMSEKASATNRISLQITGLGRSLEELQETKIRLVSFAKSFPNLDFQFQGLLRGSKLVNFRKKENETLAINLVFHLSTLNSFTRISETLQSVHFLNPSVVIMVEQEGGPSPLNFLSRFMESLHYFAAMFDSLDDCLPHDSVERLSIEKNHLGKEIKNLMNYDKDNVYYPRYERLETWKARMESHGFEGLKLSSRCLMQAKLLLRLRSHGSPVHFDRENGGFRVLERNDGKAISLGWQERCLITASAWRWV